MKELSKIDLIPKVVNGHLTGREAATLSGYSEVHISRLKKRYIENGLPGLIRAPKAPSNKTPQPLKNKIIKLYNEEYNGFNFVHFTEKLEERHNLKISDETVRKILIEAGIHTPKKQKTVYRRRRRMPAEGLLIQMDSSQHAWIPSIHRDWQLISAVDDASSRIIFAKFFPADSTFNNMFVIRKVVEREGLFTALYVDKASHFITTRHNGIHNDLSDEFANTQIQRALRELNINLISANSPQAKGRIERSFRTLQDRLINELKLYNIHDYSKANDFLINRFISVYNQKFALKNVPSLFKPCPSNINLDLVFSKSFIRKVRNDNTFQLFNHVFQIPPSEVQSSFAKKQIDVRVLSDNSVYALFNNHIILVDKFPDKRIFYYENFFSGRSLLYDTF